MKTFRNSVEFVVYGDYALFSDPILRVGGEKFSYPIPTYESIKGVVQSAYWKPTIIWIIDSIRIMKPIQTQTVSAKTLKYSEKGNDLSLYTYLKDVEYQVRAHFVWNMNRPDLKNDQNENKHHNIAKRMIERGGRRDIFLGTRECQAYIEPVQFGNGTGYYDTIEELSFGMMFHGFTYADEFLRPEDKNLLVARFWRPIMKQGIIDFIPPEQCTMTRNIRNDAIVKFSTKLNNFSGLNEFQGEEYCDELG